MQKMEKKWAIVFQLHAIDDNQMNDLGIIYVSLIRYIFF